MDSLSPLVRSGLSVRGFQSIPHVLEVRCSGEALDTNADLLTLRLYTTPDTEMLASVNLRKFKCMSSSSFASCDVNERDSRRTSLNVLVTDLKEGESRSFGCTAGYEADGWIESKSWTLEAKRNSECGVLCCGLLCVALFGEYNYIQLEEGCACE